MYDDEETIKEKRKKMIIIGSIIAGVVLLLIIFLLLKPSNKKPKEELKELDCQIDVISNATPNNGVYTQPIEVGFTNITQVSSEYHITKKTIGTTDNARNTDTFSITKSGNYKLHGYVQDEAGNKKVCDLDVTVSLTQPTCELEVTSGTLGEDGWYKSDIEIGFKVMSTNSELSSIKQYYIDQQIVDIETQENIPVNIPSGNREKYTVTDDLETTVVGYVVDTNGSQGSCILTVKKDSTSPSCTLKVKSGTLNQNGEYTDNPVIDFNTKTDDVTEVISSGVGVETNYTDESYTVTAEGMTIVYGYVKDKAGNEGMCSIAVTRPKTTQPPSPEPEPTPTPEPTPEPTANLLTSVVKKGDYVKYSAGTWNETSTNRGESASDYSWGYKTGDSKDSGTKCRGKDDPGPIKNGWRVIGVADVNGTTNVVLIHAGVPECIYHARKSAVSAADFMNHRAQSYLDGNFALQAKALDCTTLMGTCIADTYVTSFDNLSLYNIGIHYYLGTPKSSSDTLWEVTSAGRLTGFSKISNGMRPIVVLKAEVKVSGGDGTESNPWILTW